MPLKYDGGGLKEYVDSLPGANGFLAIESGVRAQGTVVLKTIKQNHAFTPRQAVGGLLDSFKLRKSDQATRAKTLAGKGMVLFGLDAQRPAGSHWHLLEYGHQAPDGSFVPAYPTVEPALENTIREQKQAFDKQCRKTSDRIAEKFKTGRLSKREQRYAGIS